MDQFGGWNTGFQSTQDLGTEQDERDISTQHAPVAQPLDLPVTETDWAPANNAWMVPTTPTQTIAGQLGAPYPTSFGSASLGVYSGIPTHTNFACNPNLAPDTSFSIANPDRPHGVSLIPEQWPSSDYSYRVNAAPVASNITRRKEVSILPATKRPSDPPSEDHGSDETLPPEVPKRKRGRPRLYVHDEPSTQWKKGDAFGPPNEAIPGETSGTSEDVDAVDNKKKDIRARNRAAATRYRNKIQALGDRLEAEERQIATERQSLLACVDQLRDEVFRLKNEVLQHSGCDCPVIQDYLSTSTQDAYSALASSQPNWIGDNPADFQGSGALLEAEERFDEYPTSPGNDVTGQ